MAVIYSHSKPNGEIFYIGIGKNINRPYSKHNRNKYWYNITNKYDYIVNIILQDVSFDGAKQIEIYLIFYYGRLDLGTGNLVNMTKGGDGVVGKIVTDETKLKMSISRSGEIWNTKRKENHLKACRERIYSTETRKRMSINNAKTKSKKVINLNNNSVFSSLKDACIELGLNYNTTKAQVRGQNLNRTNLKYL